MPALDPRERSEAVRRRIVEILQAEPGLYVEPGDITTWVSWDGRRDIGYWVSGGAVIGGTVEKPVGSGYLFVSFLDGSDDEKGPDPRHSVLDISGIPADAVGDGTALGVMALNALRAER